MAFASAICHSFSNRHDSCLTVQYNRQYFYRPGCGGIGYLRSCDPFPLMNLAAAFGALVGVGASALMSLRLGQKDYSTANDILGNVLTLNLILGLSYTAVVLLFLDPILLFFGASSETFRMPAISCLLLRLAMWLRTCILG